MESLFGVPMDSIMAVALAASLAVLLVVGFLAWRNPIILRLSLRNIPRRRAQTTLILFGLMLATLLITAAFGTGDTMTYSMRQAFTSSLGGTDLTIKRLNPQIILPGVTPDFNRAVPTFDARLLDEIKAVAGSSPLFDGWSATMEQVGTLIDTTSKQVSGQTFIRGIGTDFVQTLGSFPTLKGGAFDPGALKEGEIVLDRSAADKLDAQPGHSVQVVVAGKPTTLTVRDLIETSSPSAQFPVAFVRLSEMQRIYNAPNQITQINVSLQGGPLEGVKHSKEASDKLLGAVDRGQFTVEESKKNALDQADQIGSLFTSIFIGTALFSIAAGILLIFLIFAMLAAERKSEMGMARAVGTQRGHLTQMFVFEGLAYDLGSAAIGAALGVGVGFAMVGIISSLVSGFGFRLVTHVEARSLVVAYCLGMLITFATVAISASRVSRLNIVAAIRDIPDMPRPDKNLRLLLAEPFRVLFAERRPVGCVGAIFSLLFSLLRSGPVTGLLGVFMITSGLSLKNAVLFHTGTSLTIIALGLTLKWALNMAKMRPARRDRIAYSFIGIALLVYWALPFDTLQKWFNLPSLGIGIEQFFVGGLMMVAGAVLTIMYNSDVLLGFLTLILGGVGRMRPVLKTAVAYPMSSIFRTGMTIAMFGLIMFVLIVMSVLTGINNQVSASNPEVAGGYDIQATASYANPIGDIRARIAADPSLKGKFSIVTGQAIIPLQLRQPGAPPSAQSPSADEIKADPALAQGWRYYSVRAVDREFLQTNGFQMMIKARGYNSEREIWDAMAKDPSLIVVDALPVISGDLNATFGDSRTFSVKGVSTSRPVMEPVEIEMKIPGLPNATPVKAKIIGVLNRFAGYYPGIIVSRELASKTVPVPVPDGMYFFKAKPGENLEQLRRALGSAFINNGLEPVLIDEDLRQKQQVSVGLNRLLQGFMTLGLLVGVAALGVISTRAVVERRQQIGVLRAIGYRRNMVAASFLLESSFIALLGILIGVVLGLVLSYNMVDYFRRNAPTMQWEAPWLQILGIVVFAYVVSLLTTILPARSASRIYPAEALRYE